MKYRFTIKELQSFSDRRLMIVLLNERISGLNPYGPLAKRLRALRDKLENNQRLTKD